MCTAAIDAWHPWATMAPTGHFCVFIRSPRRAMYCTKSEAPCLPAIRRTYHLLGLDVWNLNKNKGRSLLCAANILIASCAAYAYVAAPCTNGVRRLRTSSSCIRAMCSWTSLSLHFLLPGVQCDPPAGGVQRCGEIASAPQTLSGPFRGVLADSMG